MTGQWGIEGNRTADAKGAVVLNIHRSPFCVASLVAHKQWASDNKTIVGEDHETPSSGNMLGKLRNILYNSDQTYWNLICALLGYYAASRGNFTDVSAQRICPIFKCQEVQEEKKDGKTVQAGLDFLILEDGTDTLSRNVGKGLPLDAA